MGSGVTAGRIQKIGGEARQRAEFTAAESLPELAGMAATRDCP